MTPLMCCMEIADFLRSSLSLGEYGQVYAGFLPKINTSKPEEAKKRCPAIAVRATDIDDSKENTLVHVVIYSTTYDDDIKFGSESLYHLLEKIKFELLTNNPINDRYLIDIQDNIFHTSIPDEQPFPIWWGTIEFDVYIPQPVNKRFMNRMVG